MRVAPKPVWRTPGRRGRLPLLLTVVVLSACPDADGDGAWDGVDCAPEDATIGPSATERCDGLDDDCDGQVDEGATVPLWVDQDRDGVGGAPAGAGCEGATGLVPTPGDCDDGDPSRHPGASEGCGSGDRDCDGASSAWSASGGAELDLDGDGWTPCEGDCADDDPSVLPNCEGDPPAVLDIDCDGLADAAEAGVSLIASVAGRLGRAVAIGDLERDGLADLVFRTEDPEGVGVLLGWQLRAPGPRLVADVYTFIDGQPDSFVGAALADVGDLDDDGRDDLLVGAPGYRQPGEAEPVGLVAFLSGRRLLDGGTLDVRDAEAVVIGAAGGPSVGWSVASVGNLDGNGPAEVLVEASPWMSGGLVRTLGIFRGDRLAAGGALHFASADSSITIDWTARSSTISTSWITPRAGSVGDIDGDGADDLFIALPTDGPRREGVFRLWSGAAIMAAGAFSEDDALITIRGPSLDARFGMAVEAVPDLDGDGRPELAVGAPDEDQMVGEGVGRVFILSGAQLAEGGETNAGAALTVISGRRAVGGFGTALASPGDLDGDGLGELLVSEPWGTQGCGHSGRIWVLSGADLALGGVIDLNTPPWPRSLLGRAETCVSMAGWATWCDGEELGSNLEELGDLDGDGRIDLLLWPGLWDTDSNPTGLGVVTIGE